MRSTLVDNNFDIHVGVFKVGQRNDKPRKGARPHSLVDYKAFYKIVVGGKVTHRNGLIDDKRVLLRKRYHHSLNVFITYVIGRFVYGGRVFVFNRIGCVADGKVVRFTVDLAACACRIRKFVLAAEIQPDAVGIGRSAVGKHQRMRHVGLYSVKPSFGYDKRLSVKILVGNRFARPPVLRSKLVCRDGKYRRHNAKHQQRRDRKNDSPCFCSSIFHLFSFPKKFATGDCPPLSVSTLYAADGKVTHQLFIGKYKD